jgi:uncharacterized membrane protein YfcA
MFLGCSFEKTELMYCWKQVLNLLLVFCMALGFLVSLGMFFGVNKNKNNILEDQEVRTILGISSVMCCIWYYINLTQQNMIGNNTFKKIISIISAICLGGFTGFITGIIFPGWVLFIVPSYLYIKLNEL